MTAASRTPLAVLVLLVFLFQAHFPFVFHTSTFWAQDGKILICTQQGLKWVAVEDHSPIPDVQASCPDCLLAQGLAALPPCLPVVVSTAAMVLAAGVRWWLRPRLCLWYLYSHPIPRGPPAA